MEYVLNRTTYITQNECLQRMPSAKICDHSNITVFKHTRTHVPHIGVGDDRFISLLITFLLNVDVTFLWVKHHVMCDEINDEKKTCEYLFNLFC